MLFPELNLPVFSPRVREGAEDSNYKFEIYDSRRKKWLCLTPEEYVRQAFNAFLIGHRGVPEGLIANEVRLTVNGMSRRCDTVVYSRNLRPLMIVEYKRPTVEITQEVFDQIARYNITLEAPFLAVSNGLVTYCVRFNNDTGSYSYLKDFPDYDSMLEMVRKSESGR